MDTRTFSEGSLKNRKGENFGDKTFELPFCDLKKNLGEKEKSPWMKTPAIRNPLVPPSSYIEVPPP